MIVRFSHRWYYDSGRLAEYHVTSRAWNSRGISGSTIPVGAGRLEEFATPEASETFMGTSRDATESLEAS